MTEGQRFRRAGAYSLELRDEPTEGSTFDYARKQRLGTDPTTSTHGIVCREGGAVVASCLFSAGGGASGVHDDSLVVIEDHCFVAVGDFAVALMIPSLAVVWARAVDHATCFGLHALPRRAGLVSHGELEIARLTLNGEIVWSAGGADIFTGELKVLGDVVLVTDFNDRAYSFDLETGEERTQ